MFICLSVYRYRYIDMDRYDIDIGHYFERVTISKQLKYAFYEPDVQFIFVDSKVSLCIMLLLQSFETQLGKAANESDVRH